MVIDVSKLTGGCLGGSGSSLNGRKVTVEAVVVEPVEAVVVEPVEAVVVEPVEAVVVEPVEAVVVEPVEAVVVSTAEEAETVEVTVVEQEDPVEEAQMPSMFASQTTYEEGVEPISETASKLYSLLETKAYEEVEKAGEVDFNPVEDVKRLDKVIEGIQGKLEYLLSLDVYDMLESRINSAAKETVSEVEVKGVGKITLEDPPEVEGFIPSVNPESLIALEGSIAASIDKYSKQLKELLKERRLLSGQLYGNRSGGVELMKRKVSMQQSVMKHNLLAKGRSRLKNLPGIGSGFPGLTSGTPIKN